MGAENLLNKGLEWLHPRFRIRQMNRLQSDGASKKVIRSPAHQ